MLNKVLCCLLSSLLLSLGASETYGQVWTKVIPRKDPNAEQKAIDEATQQQIRADINYLAGDNLQGRLSGSNGEMLAGTYIQKRMTEMGLLPFGKTYTRSFKFEKGYELSPDIRVSINGRYISVPEDAFPPNYSVGGKDENYVLPESKEAGSPWVLPLYNSDKEAEDGNYDWEMETYKIAKAAAERGATSVVFYDSYGSKFFPHYFNQVFNGEKLKIPVLLLNKKIYDQFVVKMNVMQPVSIDIQYKKLYKSGTNILGFINNNAPQTVVIAAHYDHLGDGTDFKPKGTAKAIYNGANDNASGVAAMLAMANKLKTSGTKRFNYLFIAFSAGEYGSAGSKAFVEATDFKKNDYSFMINLDILGGLNLQKNLWVNGVGSSLAWSPVLSKLAGNFKLLKDSAAIASSDEASFYKAGVPVLSFSSGPYTAYHQPGDDIASVNISGVREIVNFVYALNMDMTTEDSPLFTTYQASKLVEEEKGKVTFGILPDYKYKGEGVKVDGLVADQPAAQTGILQGDLILQMANFKITDIDSYKKAMANFHAGDNIKVKVKRARSLLDFTVNF